MCGCANMRMCGWAGCGHADVINLKFAVDKDVPSVQNIGRTADVFNLKFAINKVAP